jgi:hypothetical protein
MWEINLTELLTYYYSWTFIDGHSTENPILKHLLNMFIIYMAFVVNPTSVTGPGLSLYHTKLQLALSSRGMFS